MSNYVKSTNFTAKDSLPTGDTNKVIRGSEFDTEFNAIVTAISTKSDLAGPTFTGTATFADITGTGTINFTGATVSNLGSVTTVDINGGTVDGVTIGGSSAGAGTFSSLTATTADINGGTVDGVTIGGSSAGAGTFSSLTATTADINAGTVDNTVIGGTTPAAGTFSSLTATTANIDGGSIDGAVIGGSTPAAVSGTTGTFSGAVSGTTGTFSGAVTGSNLNVSNWDTAYGWGDHSTQGYLTSVAFTDIDAGAVTLSSETFSDVDNQIPTNAAVIDYVAATIPLISEVNDLSTVVTWATVPDAFISASSVNQHVSVDKATQTKTYTNGESSTITLSSAVSSGVPVVSVTKEIPQTGVTNNTWDVDSTAENYTRYNTAPATTLDFVAFGISNASYSSKSLDVSSQETGVRGIAFNNDGTKIFVVGSSGDDINEYVLSSAYDVSTGTYSQNFSVSSEDSAPTGIAFNADGTKMFINGLGGQDVNEYTLSTGFDLSTASYSQNFSVAAQETSPFGLAFSNDGTKMFVSGGVGDDVNEYTLSTGFDISTASFVDSFSVASQDAAPIAITFNNDGTKFFVAGNDNDSVYEYELSTAFDISTAVYSQEFSVSSQVSTPYGLAFDSTGTKMYVAEFGGTIYQYDTPPSSAALGTGSFASADVGKTIEANGGTFILTSTAGAFTQVTAPTSYDQVASGSWEMYAVVYNSTDGDLELSIANTGFDVSIAVYSQSFSLSSQDTVPRGVAFNTDGTKMFIVGTSGDAVYEYDLSTGFDISTAVYSRSFSIISQVPQGQGIAFNTDGTKMFITDGSSEDVSEFTLSTGFDVSTATYSTAFSITAQDTAPWGIAFNTDGTKMFVVGFTNDSVYEYALTTGFNVSTASYSQGFSVNAQDSAPTGLAFNSDGTKMFVVGNSGNDINEYTLSTGFDISTASFVDSFSVSDKEVNPSGLAFSPDGTKMFVVGYTSDSVHEYDVGTVVLLSGYHAAHTTASTNSTYWTDINSMTADEAAGDGNVYYAVSTDDRTTWKVARSTDGERSIVRNNSGTWQYNSNGTYGSETWVNATTNAELPALQEAMATSTNQMDKTQLDAVPDANHFTLGDDLDLAVIFNMSSGTTVPSSDGVSINYDANALNQGAVLGTDYNWDFPATDKVRLTSLGDYNLKVRII